MKKLSLLLAIFFVFALYTGCKYNPGPNPGTIVVVRPASGDSIVGGTQNYQITWAGSNIDPQKTFEYSLDNGATWAAIATITSDAFLYDWNVPDTFSTQALIRITDKNHATGKSDMFRITPSKPPGPGKTIVPKQGSTYIFKNAQTDSTGAVIAATIYYSRDSIAETGITYSGKSNVTHVISVEPTTGLPLGNTYINYETNGDISVYVGGGGGFAGITLPNWRTYPMQSHTSVGLKILDTSLTLPGIPVPVPIQVFDSLLFVDNGTYSVGSLNIPVFNSKDVLTYIITVIIAPLTSSTTKHISFAPSLGYMISTITDPTKSAIGAIPSVGGSQSTLVSYTLK